MLVVRCCCLLLLAVGFVLTAVVYCLVCLQCGVCRALFVVGCSLRVGRCSLRFACCFLCASCALRVGAD